MKDIIISECGYIQFPVGLHGVYILNTQCLHEWRKTALKKLIIDEISRNWVLTFEQRVLILQEIEKQMMCDFEQYKSYYEKWGTKKFDQIAKKCLDIAELCRINGRDKYN